MAGTALGTAMVISHPSEIIGTFPIKSAEVVNEGDLVGLDTNGQVVVASKTTGAIVKALGVAFFEDNNGTGGARTGVAGLTVKCGIARRAYIGNLNSTTCPAIDDGLPVFLGPVTTATVSNYTCTRTTTAGDKIQQVGLAVSPTKIFVKVSEVTDLIYQTGATSTAIFG